MARSETPVLQMLQELNRQDPAGLMPCILEMLAPGGAIGIRLFLADIEERVLQVWGDAGSAAVPPVGSILVKDSAHGEAYITGRLVSTQVESHPTLLAPVIARSERVGVLEIRLEDEASEAVRSIASGVALLLGYVILAADKWTDSFHVARRRRDMALPAEIQWNLLPIAAFTSSRVSLAGAMEPAYDIGGDVFDYACGTKELTVAIFDAMGHGLAAAQLSSLSVNAFRNARRRGDDLAEQARFIQENLEKVVMNEGFVTAQLVRVDLAAPGSSLIVNAGHPLPLLQRGTHAPVQLRLAPNLPLGLTPSAPANAEPLDLRPGDRLTLFTDGMVEATPDGGAPFGIARLSEHLVQLRDRSPREVARIMTTAVTQYRQGNLRDDATILILDIA